MSILTDYNAKLKEAEAPAINKTADPAHVQLLAQKFPIWYKENGNGADLKVASESYLGAFGDLLPDAASKKYAANELVLNYGNGIPDIEYDDGGAPTVLTNDVLVERRKAELANPQPEAGGLLANLGRSFGRGVTKTASDIPRAVGILAESFDEDGNADEGSFAAGALSAAEGIDSAVNDVDADFQDNFAVQVAGGLGQVAGFVASGLIGKGISLGAKATTGLGRAVGFLAPAAATTTTAGRTVAAASKIRAAANALPATASALAQGGVAQAEDYVQRIERDGKPVDQETRRLALGMGAIVGSSELFLPARLLKKFRVDPDKYLGAAIRNLQDPTFTKTALAKAAARGVAGGALREGGQEAGQELMFMAFGQALYDDDRQLFADAYDDFQTTAQVLNSAGVGAAVGAITEGTANMAQQFFRGRLVKKARTRADAEIAEATRLNRELTQEEAQAINDQFNAEEAANAADDINESVQEYQEDAELRDKYPALNFLNLGGVSQQEQLKVATNVESAAKPIYMQSAQDQANINELKGRYLSSDGIETMLTDFGFDETPELRTKIENIQKAIDFQTRDSRSVDADGNPIDIKGDPVAVATKELAGLEGGDAVLRVFKRMYEKPNKLYDPTLIGATNLSNEQLIDTLWTPATETENLHPIIKSIDKSRRARIEKALEADDIGQAAAEVEGAANRAKGSTKQQLNEVVDQLRELTERDSIYVAPEGYSAVGEGGADLLRNTINTARADIKAVRQSAGAQFNQIAGAVASGQLPLEGLRDFNFRGDLQATNQAIASAASAAHLKSLFADPAATKRWFNERVGEEGTRQLDNTVVTDFIAEKFNAAVEGGNFDIDKFATDVLDATAGDAVKQAFALEIKRIKDMNGLDSALFASEDNFSPKQLFKVLQGGGLTKTEITNSMRQLGLNESQILEGRKGGRRKADNQVVATAREQKGQQEGIAYIYDYFGFKELAQADLAKLDDANKAEYRDLRARVKLSVDEFLAPPTEKVGVQISAAERTAQNFNDVIAPKLAKQGMSFEAISDLRIKWVGGNDSSPDTIQADKIFTGQRDKTTNLQGNRLLAGFAAGLNGNRNVETTETVQTTGSTDTNADQRKSRQAAKDSGTAAVNAASVSQNPNTQVNPDAPLVKTVTGLKRAFAKTFSSNGILRAYGEAGVDVSETFKRMLAKVSYAHESTVRQFTVRTEQMRDAFHGSETFFTDLTTAEKAALSEGLQGNLDAAPMQARPVLELMRSDIDQLSQQVIEQMDKQIEFAKVNTDPEKSGPAIERLQNLRAVIAANKGSYLNRAYNAHIDPIRWREKFLTKEGNNTEALNKVIETYKQDTGETDQVAAEREVKIVLEASLKGGDQFSGLTGKLEEILKNKDNVPPWTRELLGEITDPMEAYAMSMSKMSEWIAKNTSQYDMLTMMQSSGLARVAPVDDIGMSSPDYVQVSQLPGISSPAYQSMYIHKDVAEFMEDFGLGGTQDDSIRMLNLASSHMKTVMTAYNVDTHVRNWIGGPLALAANGNLKPGAFLQMSESLKSLRADNQGDQATQDLRKFLVEERIVQDSASAADLINSIHDGRLDEFGDEFFRHKGSRTTSQYIDAGLTTLRFGGTVSQEIGRIYQYPDDLFRTINYFAEFRRIKEMSEGTVSDADASAEAALRTRKTMPSASESPGFVRLIRTPKTNWLALANLLYAQPFLTIAVATVQNRVEASTLAYDDIKSGVPWKAKRGRRQLAAQMMTVAAATAVSSYGLINFEEEKVDDNEHPDIFPDWIKAQEKYIEGIEGNNIIINSMQSTNPFSALTNAADILLFSDIPSSEKLEGIARILKEETLGGSIPAETYAELAKFIKDDRSRYDNLGEALMAGIATILPKEAVDTIKTANTVFGSEVVDVDEADKIMNDLRKFFNNGRTKLSMEDAFANLARFNGKVARKTTAQAKDLILAARASDDPAEVANTLVDLANDHVDSLKAIFRKSEDFRAHVAERAGWQDTDERVLKWLQRGYSGISAKEYEYLVKREQAGTLDQVSAADRVGGKRLFDADALMGKLEKAGDETSGELENTIEERKKTLKAALVLFNQKQDQLAIDLEARRR